MKRHLQLTLTLSLLSILPLGCSDTNGSKHSVPSLPAKPTADSTTPTPKDKEGLNSSIASLGFDYSADEKYLQRLGIPSRATSAYYRALPDYLLGAKADSGDKMAKTFWIERMASEALTLQQSRDASGNFQEGITEKDAVGNIGKMAMYLASLEQDPSNAMSGYLLGLSKAASIYGGPVEPIVAGIRLAGLRGDHRAAEFERKFRASHPNIDDAKVDMYFEFGRRSMEMAAIPRGP